MIMARDGLTLRVDCGATAHVAQLCCEPGFARGFRVHLLEQPPEHRHAGLLRIAPPLVRSEVVHDPLEKPANKQPSLLSPRIGPAST